MAGQKIGGTLMRLFFAFAMLSTSLAVAEEKPVEIPLKSIRALDMPGTGDVREMEPESFGKHVRELPPDEQIKLVNQSSIEQIRQSLQTEGKAEKGFVVSSPDALKAARDILTGKTKRSESLPIGEVTAVFFSRQSGSSVHVYKVERHGNTVDIHYRFMPHDDSYLSEHFALIPLGRLPAGQYEVNIIRGPMKEGLGYREKSEAEANRIVSRSFKFAVK
jgi:hypothetical protein